MPHFTNHRHWWLAASAILAISYWLAVWLPYAALQHWHILDAFANAGELQLAVNILSIGIYLLAGVLLMLLSPELSARRQDLHLLLLALLVSALQLCSLFIVSLVKPDSEPAWLSATIPFMGLWAGGRLSILLKQLRPAPPSEE